MRAILVVLMVICIVDWGRPAWGAEMGPPSYTLDDVLDLALERNPTVAGAHGAVDQSRGQQTAASAYPNPLVNVYSGHGILRDAGRTAAQAVEVQPPVAITEYNSTVSQPVEWPMTRRARKQAAAAGLQGAEAGFDETLLNLTADVREAFYELLFVQRAAEIARENVRIVEDVQRIVNVRVRLGEAPQFEAIKAGVEVLKAKQTVTRAESTVSINRVVLVTLTDGALGHTYTVRGAFERFPHALEPDALSRLASARHPSIRRLLGQLEQADRLVEFQRQARMPTVTINGSYVREIGREAVLGGLSVPAPVWYRRQGEIAGALGSKRREEAGLLRMKNELLRQVNQYYQDARTTADLITVFEQGLLKQAQEALRIAEFSFRQGATSLLEVLDAQRVQRSILGDYTQAQFELSVALVRLERAVGGSFAEALR